MIICLAAGALSISLGVSEFTLAWRHSVQKTRWEEDWRATPAGLDLTEARIEGSGAGMDPPDGARLIDRFWRWKPDLPPQRQIILRRSGATADYEICIAGRCKPMGDYLPLDADPVSIQGCD